MPGTEGDIFTYINYNDINNYAYVSSAGVVVPNPHYYNNHTLINHIFEYVQYGKGHVIIGDSHYNIEAGNFIYMKKGTPIIYYADKTEPYRKLWFGASGETINKLCEVYFGGPISVSCCAPIGELLEKFLSQLTSEGSRYSHGAPLLHTVIDILTSATEAQKYQTPKTLAVNIKEYIDTSIPNIKPLETIAAHFNISKRHLIRIFKDEFNETPSAYMNIQRFNAARRLLIETNYSATAISRLLGYCDQSYFTREFKRRSGLNPTSYRNEKNTLD